MDKTIQEIRDQYDALARTLGALASPPQAPAWKHMIVLGCGSSFSVAKTIAATAQLLFPDRPCHALPGGDFLIHMENVYAPVMHEVLLLALSRSGATDEINLAVRAAKQKYPDTKVISVVERENTELAELSDDAAELPWAFDESVCQTRSVTNLAGAALQLLAAWSGHSEITRSLETIASGGNEFLGSIDEKTRSAAGGAWENVCVLADGAGFGLAEEGALAFNEIAYTPSICRHVLDVRHGPIVLLNEKTLVLAMVTPAGFSYESAVMADLRKKGCSVAVYSAAGMPSGAEDCADVLFTFGRPLEGACAALPFLACAQLLSYWKAADKGVDPDHPVGLDPWISL